jgi:hypothetical protein
MRAEFEVRELPQSFVTKEKRYSFVEDETATPDRWGRKRQKMITEDVDSRGGWLFVIRGKPGHSIRLTSLEQVEAMKLSIRPRMIDDQTGEEVDERGIPLSVAHIVNGGRTGSMSGPHATDIDVEQTGDSLFEIESGDEDAVSAPIPDTVKAKIAELE